MAYRYQNSYGAENQDLSCNPMEGLGHNAHNSYNSMGAMGHNAHNNYHGCENGLGSSQMAGYSSYVHANPGYGLGNHHHHGQDYHHNHHGGGALASNYVANQENCLYSGNNSCDQRVIF